MPQHEQFDVLSAAVPGELGQHLQDLPQQLVYQRRAHGRDRHAEPATASAQRRTSAHPSRVCEPHTVVFAALGDSTTTAAFTCGPYPRCLDYSWATGTRVYSVLQRL